MLWSTATATNNRSYKDRIGRMLGAVQIKPNNQNIQRIASAIVKLPSVLIAADPSAPTTCSQHLCGVSSASSCWKGDSFPYASSDAQSPNWGAHLCMNSLHGGSTFLIPEMQNALVLRAGEGRCLGPPAGSVPVPRVFERKP